MTVSDGGPDAGSGDGPSETDNARVRARTQGMSYRAVFGWALMVAAIVAAGFFIVVWRP